MDNPAPAVPSPRPRPSGADVAYVLAGALLAFALLLLGILIADGASSGAIRAQWRQFGGAPWAALLAAAGVVGLPVYLVGCRFRRLSAAELGFRPTARTWVLWCVPGGFLLGLGFAALHAALGSPSADVLQASLPSGDGGWGHKIVFLVLAVTLVPLAEEAMFRGLVFQWLYDRAGPIAAGLVTAAAFGALHFDPVWAAFTGALGLVLAAVRWKSGSVWPCVVLHGAYNATAAVPVFV